MIGFYLYLFYFYFSSSFLPFISGFFAVSSSSSLLSTAFLMKIPGGLSSEYFSPLKFRLFCSLSFRILAIPVFKSDCKSATLNSQFLLKFEAICSRSLTGIFYINDRWISFSSLFSKARTFLCIKFDTLRFEFSDFWQVIVQVL